MSGHISISRTSPNSSIQDNGRKEGLRYGISASGPMDRYAFNATGHALDEQGSQSAIEFTMLGLAFTYSGPPTECAVHGGEFTLSLNGETRPYPSLLLLTEGDVVDIATGPLGNYGYVRFAQALDVPVVMGSKSTNLSAGLGGLEGCALKAGDNIQLLDGVTPRENGPSKDLPKQADHEQRSVRVLPGLHAELLGPKAWSDLFEAPFKVSNSIDRMGFRLTDSITRFDVSKMTNIVSDAVVPGDIQILGDGTPVILMRDNQPIGGYPRLATVIDADLDYVAQLRPNQDITFVPTTLEKAHQAMRSR